MLVSRRYLPRLSFDFASVVGKYIDSIGLRYSMNKSLVYAYRKAYARQKIGSFGAYSRQDLWQYAITANR